MNRLDHHTLPRVDEFDAPSVETQALWHEIRALAEKAACREAMLKQCMRRKILERESLTDAVASILADRLHCDDLREDALYDLIRNIFAEHNAMPAQVAADLNAVSERDPACINPLHVMLNLKGFHALETHRVTHTLWKEKRTEVAFALSNRASLIFGVDIHPAARIGSGVMLDHGSGIVIGETTRIDDNVSILQNVTLGGTGKERGDRHPKVCTGVMIGAGAKILGNIEIGVMSKIAAGSVVLHPVPPYCTVAGVPAKVVRRHLKAGFPAFEMDQSLTNGE